MQQGHNGVNGEAGMGEGKPLLPLEREGDSSNDTESAQEGVGRVKGEKGTELATLDYVTLMSRIGGMRWKGYWRSQTLT